MKGGQARCFILNLNHFMRVQRIACPMIRSYCELILIQDTIEERAEVKGDMDTTNPELTRATNLGVLS